MTIEGGVRLVAGTVVLLSVGMSHPKCPLYVTENMLFVTTFVGFMLVQSPFTGFCPTAIILRKLGLKGANEGTARSASS
jgi:hypothetical protein